MLAHFHNPVAGDLGLPGPPIVGWRPDGWQAQKHLAGSTRYDLELCTVNLRAAGAGQVFLVAQVAWGARRGFSRPGCLQRDCPGVAGPGLGHSPRTPLWEPDG